MSSTHWPRVVASGALWSVVYNFLWGVAWYAFMRREWLDAVAAVHGQMPWTAEVWHLWVVVTLPMGVAIMAYAASRPRSAPRAAVHAALALWLLMTLPMAALFWQRSLSLRVITLDSTVNLIAMVAASLASGWSLRDA